MPGRAFTAALVYFAGIGLGFMLVQMALLQRFSIYLGHPTRTLSITLFSMILFAGVGSYLSDRLVMSRPALERMLPVAGAAGVLLLLAMTSPVTRATIGEPLAVRSAIVVGLLAPVSVLLGFFFPTGLRLVARISPEATAWMWGVNGAFSVLGSVAAVAISIFVGIHANLIAAAVLYLVLVVPLRALQQARTAASVRAEGLAMEGHEAASPGSNSLGWEFQSEKFGGVQHGGAEQRRSPGEMSSVLGPPCFLAGRWELSS